MSTSVCYYTQECPTCGRSLRIRVAYLGKLVVCQHCQADFTATDPASALEEPDEVGSTLLERADLLLESVDRRRGIAS
jgi:ribosomal protein L37AE/L43A